MKTVAVESFEDLITYPEKTVFIDRSGNWNQIDEPYDGDHYCLTFGSEVGMKIRYVRYPVRVLLP